jgi:hypothetical protein
VSPDDLLRTVQQLDVPELDQFLCRVVAPRPGQAETDLPVQINLGLPDELRQHHDG